MPESDQWRMLHETSDRTARLEERLSHAMATIDKLSAKVDQLIAIAEKAEGAAIAGCVFGRGGYVIAASAGALIVSQWQAIKRLF